MEAVGSDGDPRWYIWKNIDDKGGEWWEHVILNANLAGHEAGGTSLAMGCPISSPSRGTTFQNTDPLIAWHPPNAVQSGLNG